MALQSTKVDKFILIDDARLFLAPPPKPHRVEQWPSIDEVITALGNVTTQKSVIIVDDAMLSIPIYAHEMVAEFVQQKITKEYYSPRLQGLRLIRKGFTMLVGH